MSAQSLSSLPKASEVVTGTLPNGISYYLVTNSESKGHADFALVQKGADDGEATKSALTELPHFQSGRPYQYLAKLGVGYQKYGHFRSEGRSVVYHFKDVPVDRQEVRDTVLLLLFDISETFPKEQAVIISGDIDKSSIQERMNVFSMMVTPREKDDGPMDRASDVNQNMIFSFVQSASREEAVLTVSYSAPRIPAESMGTVLPLVSRVFADELGVVLSSRAGQLFREKDIPLADVKWEYRSSADGPFDESYSLSLTVPPDSLDASVTLLASIMSDLDAHGVSVQEFSDARNRVLSTLRQSQTISNSEWIDKCSSSFLYGSDLASPAAAADFYATRDVSVSRECELFNSFVSTLLDKEYGLAVRYQAPVNHVPADRVVSAFNSGWNQAPGSVSREYAVHSGDTLGLYVPRKVKAKLKRVVPEPVTGGELWTFSNGMKVIYKQSSVSKGHFSFGFLLNGGYADVPGLAQGEGGLVADMLSVCDVAGLSSSSFSRLLESNGILFKPAASLTDFRITGSAPSSKFQLLLKSLLSVANSRALNENSYEYYRAAERLRISADRKRQAGINAVVDSIMCPDYIYSESRSADALADDLPLRAEKYFSRQFSKCDDGILVLVGDLDPFMLKKVLPRYLGGFTTGGIPSTRPQISYTMRSGWSTYTVEADESEVGNGDLSVNVAESVMMPFSIERYFTARVAVMELEKKLASALCETGMYSEVSSNFDLFPSEKLTVRISCRPSDGSGLPEGVIQSDPLRTLGAVRSALSELAGVESSSSSSSLASEALSKASVNASKARLLSEYEKYLSRPDGLVDVALLRYSVGKDRVSGYKDRINSITPESVREILSSLEEGGKVEYVIY